MSVILLDRENGYSYTQKFLWYTFSRVADSDKEQLNRVIKDNLPKGDGEKLMRSIADAYIEQGVAETALKMLEKGLDLNFVSSVADISPDDLLKLQKSRGKRINQG